MKTEWQNPQDATMRRVVAALKTPPAVRVPMDFAQRVMATAQARERRIDVARLAPGRAGMRLLAAATVALLLFALTLAPWATQGNRLWQTAEYVACAQLLLLGAMLFLLRRASAG